MLKTKFVPKNKKDNNSLREFQKSPSFQSLNNTGQEFRKIKLIMRMVVLFIKHWFKVQKKRQSLLLCTGIMCSSLDKRNETAAMLLPGARYCPAPSERRISEPWLGLYVIIVWTVHHSAHTLVFNNSDALDVFLVNLQLN